MHILASRRRRLSRIIFTGAFAVGFPNVAFAGTADALPAQGMVVAIPAATPSSSTPLLAIASGPAQTPVTSAVTQLRPGRSLGGVPLSNDQLSLLHGEGIVIGNQTLNNITSGNSIGGSYTAGAVNFSDQAFTNFSGIGNITVNTGAQASLQSAVNITVSLTN